MLVSYNWTKEYFKKLPKPEKLADILNKKAFEIEGLEQKTLSDGSTDWIIDVDVLPNRAHDALCHRGIAREIATITGLDLIEKEIIPISRDSLRPAGMNVNVKCTADDAYGKKVDVCRRYMLREINNIRVTESPIELKQKMEALGQKSINNIVDITNIVMFELNQPMHAFDANKISGDTIFVRNAQEGEKISTLDGQNLKLSESDPVIADSDRALAIAGVKGGKIAEVDQNTTDIVLESANFHPTIVRQTAKRTGVGTESSRRFENEITPALTEEAVELATNLILKYAKTNETVVHETVDYYPRPVRNYRTGVSVKEVNDLLGLNLSEGKIKKILNALNFEYDIVNARDKVVVEARNNIGKPHKFGSSVFFDAPNVFDCSSFTSYIYSCAGFSIPRMSIDQFVAGEEINREELQPGDLIFSNNEELDDFKTESVEYLPGTKVEGGIDHVGIYIGGDEVVHSSKHNNNGIEISKIDENKSFSKNLKYARYIKNGDDSRRFAVTVPVERLDVKTGPELIEEIGRVYGYDKIKDQKIGDFGFTAKKNKKYAINNLIRQVLIGEGFSEIITYSFVDKGSVAPEKPIADDKKFLRANLSDGMQKALEKNFHNADLLGLNHIKSFEIGTVFELDKSKKEIIEKMFLSLGVINKSGVKKPMAAEIIKDVLNKINTDINLGNVEVKDDATVIEINLNDVYDKVDVNNIPDYPDFPPALSEKYQPISPYPFVLRDIAVWMPKNTSPEKLINIIEKESGELLVNLTQFDVYEKDDKVSYAYRLVFQSHTETLTDDLVNKIMEAVNLKVEEKGWEVR